MKHLLLTTIAALVLAFSTGCSQGEIDELNTKLSQTYRSLDDVQADLAKTKKELSDVEIEMTVAQEEAEAAKAELRNAKKKLNDAEREMNVAQDQSETAYVNLHKVQRQLTEQKKRADQFAEVNQGLRGMLLQPEERVAQLEAASKALNTRYELNALVRSSARSGSTPASSGAARPVGLRVDG